jgi:hypothetical protein
MSGGPTITQSDAASDGAPSGRLQFDPWDPSYEVAAQSVGGINDSHASWIKWGVAQRIAQERAVIEADPLAALAAMAELARYEVLPPKWIVESFWSAWSRFQSLEARSLDEAFGHQPPSTRQVEAIHRDAAILHTVSDVVIGIVRADPTTTQMVLFGEAVKILKDRYNIVIGETKCAHLYRLGVQTYRLPDAHKLQKCLLEFRQLSRTAEIVKSPSSIVSAK